MIGTASEKSAGSDISGPLPDTLRTLRSAGTRTLQHFVERHLATPVGVAANAQDWRILSMRYSTPLFLLFLFGLLLMACSGQPAASPTPTKVPTFNAQAVFATYVGKWQVHDALLIIHANRTGLNQWNAGPCTQSSTETSLCNGNANMTVTVNADGSIKGTVQSVWYTQWNGKPAPAGFQSDPENLRAGDTFELQHQRAHLLYTTWLGRLSTLNSNNNRYWCDSSTSPADRPLCGA